MALSCMKFDTDMWISQLLLHNKPPQSIVTWNTQNLWIGWMVLLVWAGSAGTGWLRMASCPCLEQLEQLAQLRFSPCNLSSSRSTWAVLKSLRENRPYCISTFQASASIIFVNVSLVSQSSPMPKPRVEGWRNRLNPLIGRSAK